MRLFFSIVTVSPFLSASFSISISSHNAFPITFFACNTSVSRAGLQTPKAIVESIGNGGLSGQPIKSKCTEVIRYLSKNSQKAFPIIGVGGIHSADDAIKKIEAGADLVQIYTGFVYEGPGLVKRINKALINR